MDMYSTKLLYIDYTINTHFSYTKITYTKSVQTIIGIMLNRH